MSVSIDILTEKNFNKLIETYTKNNNNQPIDLLEIYSDYYTNFSGNLNRLYDVVCEGDNIINDFSKEIDSQIVRITKKQIQNVMGENYDTELIEKWEFIMQAFERCDDKENLYIIIE